MDGTLTPQEIEFLRTVNERAGTGDPAQPRSPISSRIQSLIDRGYLRQNRTYIPALNTMSDDICLVLTEAGKIALDALTKDEEPR